ncbi:uncharacterized protein LOC110992863 [Pieris rapae]|uniref:uncharacterized protein LOC110992863 n=1 Tax=Pieris rapae TaxID=64459 RepID=UPI001E27A880|nr:uncharacterized protein LOC110992863 [Pieris rapae]
MSSDDFQVQDVYRYSRKSYKNHHTNNIHYSENRRETDLESPRSDILRFPDARCSSCDDSEGEIANILHKKCPVIALAQQQLQKILDETDKLLCDNTQCCRTIYDFVDICREALNHQNRCVCFLVFLIIASFFIGLIFGAASCGTYLRKFNSPILSCIDNYFITERYYQDDINRLIV